MNTTKVLKRLLILLSKVDSRLHGSLVDLARYVAIKEKKPLREFLMEFEQKGVLTKQQVNAMLGYDAYNL